MSERGLVGVSVAKLSKLSGITWVPRGRVPSARESACECRGRVS